MTSCHACGHRRFFLFYTPNYCSECGGQELSNYGPEWWLLAVIGAAVVWFITK